MGRMHSSPPQEPRGNPDDPEDSVQGTLDAFEGMPEDDADPADDIEGDGPVGDADRLPWCDGQQSMQASIDVFDEAEPSTVPEREGPAPGSRAQAGIMLERAMERVALREAARCITRDELVITMARECEVPLEDLELVDCFVSDLVLEGKLKSMEDLVALAQKDDSDLYSQDLTRDEFLELYRRRYRSTARGDEE
jgi:hypothetical protein